jgi:exopolysaccharide biosynthesis polyprenyl glycosylphosphotransferase
MSRSQHRFASIGFDLVCILGALSLSGVWVRHEGEAPDVVALEVGSVWAAFSIVWLLIATRLGTYRIPPGRNLQASLRRATESWAATWGISGLVAISVLPCGDLSAVWLFASGLLLLLGARAAISVTPLGRMSTPTQALIIGSCPSARALSTPRPGEIPDHEFVGAVPFRGENAQHMAHLPVLGQTADLPTILRERQIDVALVSPSDVAVTGEIHRVFHVCDEHGLAIQYFPSFLDVDHQRIGLAWSEDRPGLSMQAMQSSSLAQVTKRCLDFAGAAIGLIGLAPVFLVCAIVIKATSPGPVFYRQQRVGKFGRLFNCLKFRSMREGAHAQQDLLRSNSIQDGPAFKVENDPRVTPVGRLLRKFSLDELPQLINVLLGDMSLVGPRPPIPKEVEKYTWWQRRRIAVKPGLTCVWQVYGRNRVSFKRWVEMDLYYIDNWSLWLDLKLIAHTFRVVLRGTGM